MIINRGERVTTKQNKKEKRKIRDQRKTRVVKRRGKET